jgi:hypothetical protein
MDRFEKITSAYVLIFLASIAVIISFSGSMAVYARIGFILVHLVYLKFMMNDVVERGASRVWLFVSSLFTVVGIVPYTYVRRS